MRPAFQIAILTMLFSCSSVGTSRQLAVLTVSVVGDHVLVGRAVSFGSDGSFEVSAITDPPISCEGTFSYHALPHGRARYKCNNGLSGTIRIEADGHLRGAGSGATDLGIMHTVFGYSLDQVNRRLSFPNKQTLVFLDGKYGLSIEEQSPPSE